MSYCDLTGLSARFGEDEITALTDRADTGAVDTDVAQQALDDATEEINSYLAARYPLPLSETPSLLVRLCADIARYLLMDNRVTEEVEKRYDRAVQTLRHIAAGKAELNLSTGQNAATGSLDFAVCKDDSDRIFTSDTLKDF